jgi:Saxitoxin biosynthesis operon protein SxtJ
MQWSDIPFDPPRKTLRQFAGLWLAFFGGMAVWQALVKGHVALGLSLAALALVVGLAGLTRPEWLRFIYVGWMVLAFPIGWTVSQVMLALMFYGLFAPIGLVFRLIGRDPLRRARPSGRESYWDPKPAPTDLGRYFKQF